MDGSHLSATHDQIAEQELAVAVGLENNSLRAPGYSRIVIFDLAVPEAPVRVASIETTEALSQLAGSAAFTKLKDGRFLILGHSYGTIAAYVSSGTDLKTSTWTYYDGWAPSELISSDASVFTDQFQSLQLLTQCDGTLYLVGSANTDSLRGGTDYAELFALRHRNTGTDLEIEKVARKEYDCGGWCSLAAAFGPYVGPGGQLFLYGAEHGATLPVSGDNLAVRMRELVP